MREGGMGPETAGQPRLGGDPLTGPKRGALPAQPKASWVDPRERWENR